MKHTFTKRFGVSFGACVVAATAASCGGDPGQGQDPESATESPTLPAQSAETVGQVRQAAVSSSWLVGSGATGLNTVTADSQLGTDSSSNFAVEVLVHGSRALRLEPANNVIGGYGANGAYAGVTGATIGGGGAAWLANVVTDSGGFVGGGYHNRAGNATGTAGDANQAVVVGGSDNTASGMSSFVGGGLGNKATGSWSFVGAGNYNEARGEGSFVGGGTGNLAGGAYSFAGGWDAQADFDGCFVWADFAGAGPLSCGAANRFVARAAGGVYFYSDSATTAGVKLTPGSGAFAPLSDRNAKKDFVPVKPQQVLARVASMPLSTWTYKSEPGVRHMGPMAQDFRAAFGLGTDDKSIVTVDADGVALAAIQGLNEKVTRLEAENELLRGRLDRLEAGRPPALGATMPGGGFVAAGLGLGAALAIGRQRRSDKRHPRDDR